MGFGDEATAAVAATIAKAKGEADFGTAYDDILKDERHSVAQFQQQQPAQAFATELMGGAGPGGALNKLARKVRGTLASRVARSPVTQAAVQGGVTGAGNAKGGDRTAGAVVGAGLGAGVAGTTGLAGAGLRALFKSMGLTNVDKDTARTLLEAMRRDGLDPKQVLEGAGDLVQRTQRPVALADILADKKATHTMQVVDAALSKAGGHKPTVVQALEDRLGQQKDRVLVDVADATAQLPRATRETIQEMIQRRKDATTGDYAKAFGDKTRLKLPELQQLHTNGGMDDAFKQLQETMRVKGKEVPTRWATDAELASIPPALIAGEKNPKTGKTPFFSPTLEQYHEMKSHLWDLEQKAKLLNPLGEDKATKLSMAYGNARRNLKDLLGNIGGETYKRAEAKFGGESKLVEAAQLGSNLFKTDPAKIREVVAKMDAAEKEALLAGFSGHVQDGVERWS